MRNLAYNNNLAQNDISADHKNQVMVTVMVMVMQQVINASKVSKYGVFSSPYFPAFGPEKNPYLDTFQAVNGSVNIKFSTNSMSKFYRKEEYNKKFKVAAYVNN